MLTETATLPRPSQVMTLEKLPPGQEATRIMPSASSGSMFSSQVNRQVAAGSNRNCANRPATGATGALMTRLKSSSVRLSDTPNIMQAMIRLSMIRLAGSN